LIRGIEVIEIVVVHGHGYQVLSSALRKEFGEGVRIPMTSSPKRQKILEAKFTWVAKVGKVISINLIAFRVFGVLLQIHFASIPSVVFSRRVNSPMEENSELCISKPLRGLFTFE
jgi:hypothetical protein